MTRIREISGEKSSTSEMSFIRRTMVMALSDDTNTGAATCRDGVLQQKSDSSVIGRLKLTMVSLKK